MANANSTIDYLAQMAIDYRGLSHTAAIPWTAPHIRVWGSHTQLGVG
jgi:hypothetical protein